MDMTGEERIPVSRDVVWAALNNPNVLRKCITNCDKLERKSPTEFDAAVKMKVGPISTTFKGQITLTNIVDDVSYTMNVEGQGGIAGSAKGTCDVALSDDGEGTLLTYTVKAQIAGKLALLGSKMIDTSSKKLAAGFFVKFNRIVAKRAARQAENGDE